MTMRSLKSINLISLSMLLITACGPADSTATPARVIFPTITTTTSAPAASITPTPSLTPTAAPTLAQSQLVKTIDTRPGVTMRLLISTPEGSPKGMLMIFPGGDGTNHFRETGGQIILGGNFLVRSIPLFLKSGFASAVVDAPSDRSGGMNGAFRTSPAHAQDIQAAIAFLGKQGFESIYLVGTSAGTLSAGYAPTLIKDARVKGVVLTSSLGSFFASLLGNAPLDKITAPILMVHHRDDGCEFSKFQDALGLKSRFFKVDFVEVRGGSPPRSIPCEAMSYHGYLDMEEPVVQVITDWISGKNVPSLIGQ